MKIGIDARLYTQTGVGRYLRNLIEELEKQDIKNEYIIYLRSQEYDLVKLQSNKWRKRRVDIPWHTVSEQLKFPGILLSDNLDLVHFPYFNVPIFYPKKYLLTIHDLIVDHFDTGRASTLPYPVYMIKRLGYKLSLKMGIKKATRITAISETTRSEIEDHYGVSGDKITVTYDALDSKFKETVKAQKAINYYKFPYILYVGNAYPHKNLERLVKAFLLIKRKKTDLKLVLAGNDNYFYPRLKDFADKFGLANEIVFFGSANDVELVNLYTYAICLVFPSLMEGFGLPNFEAVACKRLPVVSDIPVFREIWGDNLNFFDPYDEKSMADEILKVISLDRPVYQKKAKSLQKTVDKYSWNKTTGETLKIYENCIRL